MFSLQRPLKHISSFFLVASVLEYFKAGNTSGYYTKISYIQQIRIFRKLNAYNEAINHTFIVTV